MSVRAQEQSQRQSARDWACDGIGLGTDTEEFILWHTREELHGAAAVALGQPGIDARARLLSERLFGDSIPDGHACEDGLPTHSALDLVEVGYLPTAPLDDRVFDAQVVSMRQELHCLLDLLDQEDQTDES